MKPHPLKNIRVVLVSPIYGGNVGAVCRAMKNCGITHLAIVAPRDDFDTFEAQKMALHAVDIFTERQVYPSLAEAVADCGLVIGTTARLGLYRSHAKTPRDIAPRIIETAATTPVAIVFGREDNGLDNDDLARCTSLVQIPSSNLYSSLNLSHAVMICCYEIFLQSNSFDRAAYELSPEAPIKLREKMFEVWREALLAIDFMEEGKADHMMLGIRRVLSRGKLSTSDAKIMIGIARQMLWIANNR